MATNVSTLTIRWPAMLIAGVLIAAVVGAALVRISGKEIRQPDASSVLVRELRFEDRADGSVAVIDSRSNKEIHVVYGEAGFLRGTLRSFARDRKARGLGAKEPFKLIARADGRLTLADPATGRLVDLESFGPVNAAAFAALLHK